MHTSGDEIKKLNHGIFMRKIKGNLKNKEIIIKNYIIGEIIVNDKNINENKRIINSFEEEKRNERPI